MQGYPGRKFRRPRTSLKLDDDRPLVRLANAREHMKKPRKRKPSNLTRLKKRLEQLSLEFSAAPSDITKAKLIVQIRATEEQIKIESIHRITGFNQVKGYEILSGAPGLGKRS